jgi:hypothetical protein
MPEEPEYQRTNPKCVTGRSQDETGNSPTHGSGSLCTPGEPGHQNACLSVGIRPRHNRKSGSHSRRIHDGESWEPGRPRVSGCGTRKPRNCKPIGTSNLPCSNDAKPSASSSQTPAFKLRATQPPVPQHNAAAVYANRTHAEARRACLHVSFQLNFTVPQSLPHPFYEKARRRKKANGSPGQN